MTDFIQVRGFEDAIRSPVRPKRARITDRATVASRSRADMAPRARLDRIARRVPEVMVKITGRTKDGGHLAAHLAYISRNSALPLEGPDGERLETRETVRSLAADWMAELEADPRRRKDASVSLSIVLSMPPGTDPFRMHDASRAFATRTFGETHPYVFAFHTDERHPHVHLTVRTLGHDGRKLNPRKADLEQWRQIFAAVLRDRGVEAEATPRRARGVVRKAEVGAVRRMRDRFDKGQGAPAKVEIGVVKAALEQPRRQPWTEAIRERQSAVRKYFVAQAVALSRSPEADDQRLAKTLETFVKTMPPVETRQEVLAREIEGRAGKATAKDREPIRRR
ncbi:relaxase/mobilization nuclease domain-containing protein [Brevundimonas sp.]|uniref:relaxase/mobilization nuclease domain-containing protein n=1 Tax=Brevundimonas sp. TaxID=1871086 RepID=UPI001A2F1D78|nr:relaxase/mobilization nuclease domain-containing protein [Brevundimonas sp.]MBJ7483491.1 relaxase/mobilization nuclease domain-containing protein [Brevundimonas sp.]